MIAAVLLWCTLGAIVPPLDVALSAHRLAVVERIAARNRIDPNHPAIQAYHQQHAKNQAFHRPVLTQLLCIIVAAPLVSWLLLAHLRTLHTLRRAP